MKSIIKVTNGKKFNEYSSKKKDHAMTHNDTHKIYENLKYFSLNEMKTQLGETCCKNVLFMHAFLGCDTTSWIYYSIGKVVIMKKFIELLLGCYSCGNI